MVRLKNPMVDIASAGDPPPRPGSLSPQWAGRLDEALTSEVRAVVGPGRGRVLFVGAGWPATAFELAREGRFVTLLDPSLERLKPLREEVASTGLASHLTLDSRPYGDVSFESGTFEAVVLFDPFPYMASPAALIKKAGRELRAGGTLLILTVLARGAPYPETAVARGLRVAPLQVPPPQKLVNYLAAARDKLLSGTYRGLSLLHLLSSDARERHSRGELSVPPWRRPSWDELFTALSQQLVVMRVVPLELLAFEVSELAAALSDRLAAGVRALVGPAARLDRRLLEHPTGRALAPAVLVIASKERELGRVFQTGRRGNPNSPSN